MILATKTERKNEYIQTMKFVLTTFSYHSQLEKIDTSIARLKSTNRLSPNRITVKRKNMITKELAKQLIEQAEYNCSGEKVEYNIEDILPLSEDGAYLVFASSESCKTSFVCYEDGTAYFLSDWQGCYPVSENAIAEFNNWVTIGWKESPVIFNGLPRVLFDLN